MEQKKEEINEIVGAEGIVIHNGNIVLGMQNEKRWYKSSEGKTAAIIKTLGGKIEKIDKNARQALLRELFEEVKGMEREDIKISKNPVFNKKIKFGELNPFESQSKLKMSADFYILEISKEKKLEPNDLPALIEIPIDDFLELEFSKTINLKQLENYIIKSHERIYKMPDECAFMIPDEVREILRNCCFEA